MKYFSVALTSLLIMGAAWGKCHEVVKGSSYRTEDEIRIDRLCIDNQDFITLYYGEEFVYSFQSEVEIRNAGYRCWRRRDENPVCGHTKGDIFLVYSDALIKFQAHVHEHPEHNNSLIYTSW